MNEEKREERQETAPETAEDAAVRDGAVRDGAVRDAAGNAEPDTKKTDEAKPDAETKPETFTFTREEVEKLEDAAKQLETFKEHFVRQAAEYENYRKRTAREKETLYQDAKADTIRAFLPVYDDLERAVHQEGGEDSPHKKGLEMIFQKYGEILKSLGVTEIEALGKPFDPEQHNAVQHIEDENAGENTVAQVFQAGFTLNGKVIRHAMVVVAN